MYIVLIHTAPHIDEEPAICIVLEQFSCLSTVKHVSLSYNNIMIAILGGIPG